MAEYTIALSVILTVETAGDPWKKGDQYAEQIEPLLASELDAECREVYVEVDGYEEENDPEPGS